jgi:hypothetical protein
VAGIVDQWPSYPAYGTSFWTIGGVWLVRLADCGDRLLVVSLLVVLLPTRLECRLRTG